MIDQLEGEILRQLHHESQTPLKASIQPKSDQPEQSVQTNGPTHKSSVQKSEKLEKSEKFTEDTPRMMTEPNYGENLYYRG